ncbi:hypothetical protein [Alienimonas chondri]|uniref:Secreted protein n=1 Tax=Alienimonas chondri TaxID=2681879 RepID=A0ABX1VFQ9_9PLAN|nr:hypothetical protein [Alienimonas chondri]NNJ26673.1 hypothetical protein [Alienimonas chondri]
MSSLLHLPLALLAALPLLLGPAAWAADCGCAALCGTGAETAAVCECGPADCAACCDASGHEDDEPSTAGCACGCEPAAPVAPTVPTVDPVPVPSALALPPAWRGVTNESVSLERTSGDAPPATNARRRSQLCVWRN